MYALAFGIIILIAIWWLSKVLKNIIYCSLFITCLCCEYTIEMVIQPFQFSTATLVACRNFGLVLPNSVWCYFLEQFLHNLYHQDALYDTMRIQEYLLAFVCVSETNTMSIFRLKIKMSKMFWFLTSLAILLAFQVAILNILYVISIIRVVSVFSIRPIFSMNSFITWFNSCITSAISRLEFDDTIYSYVAYLFWHVVDCLVSVFVTEA